MPNWCQNSLNIEGNPSEVAKFREWLNDEPLTLQKILPMPSELEGTTSPTPKGEEENAKLLTEKYGASNWYDWHVNNWGTKWDVEANEDDCNTTDSDIVYWFDSAWSPPTKAIIALAKLFPNLSFTLTYREDGCQFAGILKISGDDYEDIYHDSSQDEVAYRQFVIDEFGEDPFASFDDEMEENEAGQVTEVPKPSEKPTKKKVKKNTKKAPKKVKPSKKKTKKKK
jgi:hypothetical protein